MLSNLVAVPSPVRVVLVRPVYGSNLGMSCRVMKNFGFGDLVIVQPSKRNPKTKAAVMYAKHSGEILADARVVKTLDAAVADCQLVVGTTGAPGRFHRQLKSCIPLSKLKRRLKGRVAIVFGSEGAGLSADESNACDLLVHVPANPAHPVLNLSHAVAVVLYVLSGMAWSPVSASAELEKRRVLEQKFERLISGLDRVKDKKKVALAFRRMLGRSEATADEVQALMAALAALEKA